MYYCLVFLFWLHTETAIQHYVLIQKKLNKLNKCTYSGLISSWSLSSAGTSTSTLRFAAMVFSHLNLAGYFENINKLNRVIAALYSVE